jgi:PPOX class probable F420-dependent enzyme
LLSGRLIANFATVNRDGTVHLVPLWFMWRAPHVLLPTNGATRKIRNLQRDPRATVMIDDSRGGFDLRGVTLVGEAEVDRSAEAADLNHEIHLKYLSEAERGHPDVDRYLATDDVTIRFTPQRVSSFDLRDTPQGRAAGAQGWSRPLG